MSLISGSGPIETKTHIPGGVNGRPIPPLLYIVLLVAACKLVFYIADPYPSFHFGDSGAYLATALANWIPPDRSFTYGFFLRPLTFGTHSLGPVLAVQIVASGVASVVVGSVLLRYFRATPAVAMVFACLSAIEPVQLMSERFVMTEALATFVFAIYLWAALSFVESGRIPAIVAAQILGVISVSLRYSFLPLFLLLSVALPILSAYRGLRTSWKPFLTRLIVAVVASQILLAGYRHLYGSLAHTKPAYLSRDGDFLLADMAPLITPEDFPIANERARLFQKVRIPLKDPANRRLHRWVEGGLCHAILDFAKQDEDLANSLARRTALRAMKRDPIGVLGLGAGTYKDFLTYKSVAWALRLDQGYFVGPTENDIKMIRQWFGIDALDRKFESVTKKWQGSAVLWCWLVVLSPLIYALEMLWHRRRVGPQDWLLLLCAVCTLGSAIVPVEIANPRYLVPLPWISLLLFGVMASRLRAQSPKPTSGSST